MDPMFILKSSLRARCDGLPPQRIREGNSRERPTGRLLLRQGTRGWVDRHEASAALPGR